MERGSDFASDPRAMMKKKKRETMVSRKMRGYNSIVSRFSGAKKMGKDRARKSTSTACNGGRRKVCSEARRKRLRGDRRDCCRQCDMIMMVKSEFLVCNA